MATKSNIYIVDIDGKKSSLQTPLVSAYLVTYGGEKAPLNVAEVGKAASQKGRVGLADRL